MSDFPHTPPKMSWTFSNDVNAEIRRAAATGIYDIRGGGSKRRLPHFDDLLFLGASISRYPLEGYREKCATDVWLGTRFAKKPIHLDIPITIAGMSFGALSGPAKEALGRGASGVRWQIIALIEGMLAAGVTPVIPAQGSVGASGDLAPLAHMTATMIGHGQAEYQGEILPSATALARAGLTPVTLGPKEGLALINGTQFSTAYALAGLFDAWRAAQSALVTSAGSGTAPSTGTTMSGDVPQVT